MKKFFFIAIFIYALVAWIYSYDMLPITGTDVDGNTIYGVPTGWQYYPWWAYTNYYNFAGIVIGLALLGALIGQVGTISGLEDVKALGSMFNIVMLSLALTIGLLVQNPSGSREGVQDRIHRKIDEMNKTGTGALQQPIPVPHGTFTQPAEDALGIDLSKERLPPVSVWWLPAVLIGVGLWFFGHIISLPLKWRALLVLAGIVYITGTYGIVGRIAGILLLLWMLTQIPGLIKWMPKWMSIATGIIIALLGLIAYGHMNGWWRDLGEFFSKWGSWIFWGIVIAAFCFFGYHFIQDRNKILDEEDEERRKKGISR